VKIACFDCFAGASGNMIAGALVDAGVDLDALERELRRLPVDGWSIAADRVRKHGLGATYVDVRVPGEDHDHHHHFRAHAHRKLGDVLAILDAANFAQPVAQMATAIYRRLALAESRVHRVPVDEIAFHEVGQIDAIVDVACAALGLSQLGIDRVYCSAMPCGKGTIESAHGPMPSPPPATMELLRGIPTYFVDVDGELVTPTGAAILTTIASFEPRPPMVVDSIGYGAGRSDFPFANVLRVVIGETVVQTDDDAKRDDVVSIETNIDDMNPQLYDHVLERLFAAGALDAWTAHLQMKKGRPGTQVCVLAPAERADAISALLLAETTTIGVRSWHVRRDVLARETAAIETSLGTVRVKIVAAPSGERVTPEYEDCLSIARRDGMTLRDVMRTIETEATQWLARRAK